MQPRMLMGPGPSDVHPRVLAAMARPTVGHLDPQFVEVLDDIRDMLQSVFQTRNELTLAVSGTGSAGMETGVVNLIEPGDRMLVCVGGVFGARMSDIVERLRGKLVRVDQEWGRAVDPEAVRKASAFLQRLLRQAHRLGSGARVLHPTPQTGGEVVNS